MPRDGDRRVFARLVFEDDVARIFGLAEDCDDPGEVGVFLGLPLAADLGLDLDVDRVGGELGEVGVGVVAVEVAGVEVDAEVGRVDGLDQLQELRRGSR